MIVGFQSSFAQQKVAILNTEDDGEPPIKHNELSILTAKLRDIARKTLPKDYEIMTEQSIQSFLGSQKEMERVCNAADGCLAKIGRDIEADYIGQARIARFGKFFAIKVEIYNSGKGILVGSFMDDASKDIYALSAVIDKKAPDMFKELSSVASVTSVPITPLPAIATTNTFKTVKIGNQVWMAENLNVDVPGSKCYDNKPTNCDKYGRLYDWNTAMKVCPSGWHLPTKTEWEIMTKYIGGEKTEGRYLKAKSGWNNNGNGIDKFGFTALPGGIGSSSGDFYYVGRYGYWWSASDLNAGSAYCRVMYYISEYANWYNYGKTYLYSVRCVQD